MKEEESAYRPSDSRFYRRNSGMRALVPNNIAVVEKDIESKAGVLYPEELRYVMGACERRSHEFAVGRTCARMALNDIGFSNPVILMNEARAPTWPNGIVGSIAHSASKCAAVVGSAADYLAIGIDIEDDQLLPAELSHIVMNSAEIAVASKYMDVESAAILFFSIKESIFKAWHPVVTSWLDFQDTTVDIDLLNGCFEARLNKHVAPFPKILSGRFSRAAQIVMTAVTVPL
jgi:4'-phosphopantetheinyl transferase EntD